MSIKHDMGSSFVGKTSYYISPTLSRRIMEITQLHDGVKKTL